MSSSTFHPPLSPGDLSIGRLRRSLEWQGRWTFRPIPIPWLREAARRRTSRFFWSLTEINGRSPESNRWRYVSTIFLAIFCGDIPLHRPYIGLTHGRYLHFRILKFPLKFSFHQPKLGFWTVQPIEMVISSTKCGLCNKLVWNLAGYDSGLWMFMVDIPSGNLT